jgi:hypothetical protein
MLHGRFLPWTLKTALPGPLHLLMAIEEIDPMPVPDRPVPDVRVPAALVWTQTIAMLLVVSVSVKSPDFTPVQDPPGVTVQVEAVVASDAVAPRPMASAAAPAVMRTARAR